MHHRRAGRPPKSQVRQSALDAAGRDAKNGPVTQAPEHDRSSQAAGASSQRQHILDTALALMSQRGVDGTSMRDLASAAGLNVASLYHYFPSKRDLLVSVLEERGFISDLTNARPVTVTRDRVDGLAELLDDMLGSMLEVEAFVRLMLGEALRGDETAHAVGVELFGATQESLERWVAENEAATSERAGAPALARVLRALIVGMIVEHLSGVLEDSGDVAAAFHRRAGEAAAVLRSGL